MSGLVNTWNYVLFRFPLLTDFSLNNLLKEDSYIKESETAQALIKVCTMMTRIGGGWR